MASINEKLTTINNSFASMRSIYGGADNNTSIGELQEAVVPKKGIIPIDYNETGYPSKLRIREIGNTIPARILNRYLWQKVEEVIIEDKITSIEESAFGSCKMLKNINFSNGLEITKIPSSVFSFCEKLDASTFLEWKNITELGYYCFQNSAITTADLTNINLMRDRAFYKCEQLTKVVFSNTLSSIPRECFSGCIALTEMNFPSTLRTIYTSGLSNTGFKKLSLPETLTYIQERGLQSCKQLIQLSYCGDLEETTAYGTGPIAHNPKLKAVWLGNKFTSTSGTTQMNSCSSLKKIFIDLPRATVESYAGYSTAWGSYCKEIICNDDEGFMSREDFDNFDWENYQ